MVDEQELHHALLRRRPPARSASRPSCPRSRAWRTRAAASAPSRPARGTCGSWRRSTASCDSRSAARRCRACSRRPSPCCRAGPARACRRFRDCSMRRRAQTIRRARGSCLWSMWCWNSSRKCLMKLFTGIAAASPSAQIVRPCDVVGDRVQQVEVLVAALAVLDAVDARATASRCLRGTACTGRTTPRSRSTTAAAATSPCSASRP